MGYLLGFRYNIETEEQDLTDYINIVKKWLKDKKLDILRSTGGVHAEASTLHTHYHMEISNKLPFKTEPLPTFKNHNKDFKLTNRQMSIKFSEEQSEENIIRFLQYPLKEGKPIMPMVHNIHDLEQMIKDAKAEYKATKVFKKKQEAEQAKKNSKKQSLFMHLDETRHNSLVEVVRATLRYYKSIEDAPHPRQQVASAEVYACKKGIWTEDQILERYLSKKDLERGENIKYAFDLGEN